MPGTDVPNITKRIHLEPLVRDPLRWNRYWPLGGKATLSLDIAQDILTDFHPPTDITLALIQADGPTLEIQKVYFDTS
jgi:hypothetical protein